MHSLITFRRIVLAGIKNFFRNSWLSVAATAVMIVALFIMQSALVLNVATHNAIAELSTNIKISIYLKDDYNDDLRQLLQKELAEDTDVAEVLFINNDTAKDAFTERNKEDTGLLEGLALVGIDALPESIEVGVRDLSKIEAIGEIPKQERYASIVDSVSLGKTDAKKTIENAANLQRYITLSSIIAASVFGVVSMLIIFNTIRMAIFTRSDEIRTQKLLGATPGYIRGPFLVESSMYGVIAGIISASVVMVTVVFIGNKVATQPEFMHTYDFFTAPATIFLLYVSSIFLGILVGVVSSSLAMNRYLKIKHW